MAEAIRGNQVQFIWQPMYWDLDAIIKEEALDWAARWPLKPMPERLDDDINPDDPDDN